MIKAVIKDYKRSSSKKKVFLVMFIYRLGNKIYYMNLPNGIRKILLFILKILQVFFLELLFHIELPFSVKIGEGIRLVHLNGIIFHPKAEIGINCTIFHQVTIGANEHRHDYKEGAKIGDNVYIGAGAKIIGNIFIGDNVRIGANAVVTKNIIKNSTVICRQTIIKTEKNELKRDGII